MLQIQNIVDGLVEKNMVIRKPNRKGVTLTYFKLLQLRSMEVSCETYNLMCPNRK